MKIIEDIKILLNNELPGMEAHLKLTPYRKLTKVIPENRREGAVMMLLYETNNELFFPLIQRHAYEGVHSNQISFPGGKKEESDASMLEAAQRETSEEIGVSPKTTNYLGRLSEIYIPPSNFLVSPYVSFANVKPIFVKEEREVKDILEIPLNELLQSTIQHTEVLINNGLKFKTPCFVLQEQIVWGATAAILSEFKDLLVQ